MKYIIIILLTGTFISSCKKNNGPAAPGVTTLNIINAIPGSSGLITNINKSLPYYLGQSTADYGTIKPYFFDGGTTSVSLRQSSDTSNSVYASMLSLPDYTIHSLFISGTITSPDTLFLTDNPPYQGSSDSTFGIRFVNLQIGGNAVSINLQGKANGSEVSSLSYKGNTGFTNYSAHYMDSSYTFIFRDASTGDSLTEYTLGNVYNGAGTNTNNNTYRFRNFTLMLYGNAAGSPALATALLNNY